MANGRDGKWEHQMREGEQQERAMAMANGRCVSSRKNGRVRVLFLVFCSFVTVQCSKSSFLFR